MFEWVLILELVLLLFVVPGLSASAITGERDRQTLIPLQVTMMSPAGIFFGKVLSSSSFVLLLVVASTPILAVAYLLGGITIMQAIQGVAALMFIGVVLAVVGVACSAMMRGSAAATLFAYGMSLVFMMGTGFAVLALIIVYVALGNDSFDTPPRVVSLPLLLNPFVSLSYAAGDINDNLFSPWPLSAIKQGMAGWEDTSWISGTHFGNGFDDEGNRALNQSGWVGLELWLRAAAAQAAMAALLAWRGIKRLTTPSEVVRQ